MINKKLLSFDPAAMRYVWRCVLKSEAKRS